jgi:Bacterial protein of unknown function (DUF839)
MRIVRAPSIAAALLIGSVSGAMAQVTGPSSSQLPYIVPTQPDWHVASLLTVGDTPLFDPSYRMVGIPDGLGALGGAFDPRTGRYLFDRTFMTVFMNHELGATLGAVRAHGQTGAFVSQWTIHLNSFLVVGGQDLSKQVYTWNGASYVLTTDTTAQYGRLCSADLPAWTAFYNPSTGRGFNGRIFMNGEEVGLEGRAFGHILTGTGHGQSYELPYLGRFSRENSLAHPDAGDKTIVVGLDDSTPGQLYLYVGSKRSSGNAIERAGLAGGKLYGIAVTDGGSNYLGGAVAQENNGAIQDGTFALVDVTAPPAELQSGAALQARSMSAGVTEFAKPEDGHWDTKHRRVFYFVTTGASIGNPAQTQTSRLYKLTFDSIRNPTGGTIELVVDSKDLIGTDGQSARSFDNMTVDGDGHVILQEDPGSGAYIAKVWDLDPHKPLEAVQAFEFDRDRFEPGAPNFLTVDEETSGVIDVTPLVTSAWWFQKGRRYYLGVVQAHYPKETTLVEGGQFYLMAGPDKGHKRGHDHDGDDDRSDIGERNKE